MKLGIIGLPQTGKKNLFELLTGSPINETQLASGKPLLGFASIRDHRFEKLASMYKPKKETPAQIELVLLPKIEKNPETDEKLYRETADADAICHVVRAFEDDSIYHIDGSVNPVRDIEAVNAEFILHDLLFAEKRIERIVKESKKRNDPAVKNEEILMKQFMEHLEQDKPLRLLDLSEEESKLIRGYPLLTLKKLFLVCNVSEDSITDQSLLDQINARFSGQGIKSIMVSATMEKEISLLDSAEEREEFMKDAGITEPSLNLLSRVAMESLGLMSYFTVGSDEVRQWQVRQGSTAPEAAGAIHSDIQRGFIRAEVIKYNDLVEAGSEEAVKKAGKLMTMGKDYIVEDGDIISFRFNV